MATNAKSEFLAQLESMSVEDLNEFVRAIEQDFGVSAKAMAAHSGEAKTKQSGVARERLEFSLKLDRVGSNKLQVIKIIHEITGVGLMEAKGFVDSAPRLIKVIGSQADAKNAIQRLSASGASAAIQETGSRSGGASSLRFSSKDESDMTTTSHTSLAHSLNMLALERLSAESLGISLDLVPLTRVLPVTVYLRDGTHAEEVVTELEEFLKKFDLSVLHREPPIIGSFFGRLWAKTFDKETTEELRKKLEKAERALETQHINKPQSEANLNNAQAGAALMNAMGKESKSCAIQVGNLLLLVLVDANGDRHSRTLTLTEEQCLFLQANQDLILEPESLLKRLSGPTKKTGT